MTDKKSVSELVDEFHKLREELSKRLQGEFKNLISEVFEANPEVYGIVWNQYTPYFNDGEPCEFTVSDFEPVMSLKEFTARQEDKGEPDEFYADKYQEYLECGSAYNFEDENCGMDWMRYSSTEKESFKEAIEQISKIPDDVFRDMFGDHVTVLATRDKITTEEYSHD